MADRRSPSETSLTLDITTVTVTRISVKRAAAAQLVAGLEVPIDMTFGAGGNEVPFPALPHKLPIRAGRGR